MSTQLSHHCKTSLYRVMFGNTHGESIVFLMAGSRGTAQKRATDALLLSMASRLMMCISTTSPHCAS
jgi:hypothetical protein